MQAWHYELLLLFKQIQNNVSRVIKVSSIGCLILLQGFDDANNARPKSLRMMSSFENKITRRIFIWNRKISSLLASLN